MDTAEIIYMLNNNGYAVMFPGQVVFLFLTVIVLSMVVAYQWGRLKGAGL